jgi:hypothetical protein
VRLHPSDQFAETVRGQTFSRDHELWVDGHEPDGREILLQIIGQGVDDIADMSVPLAEIDRVSVGRRTREPANPNAAARAANVLDDHRLAQ